MSLHQKHNYLNKQITHLVNTPIVEWDMKSGGYSILKRGNFLTESELSLLEAMDNRRRNVWIGELGRKEKEINQILLEGFEEARRQLFERNSIADSQVLTVKKDAIYIINQPLKETEFDGFTFRAKNTYSSYYYLNDKEFYFRGRTGELDVKGIGDDDLEAHRDFFLKDLSGIFRVAERGSREMLIRHIRRYRDQYLRKQLPVETYREMNMDNSYRTVYENSMGVVMMDAWDDMDTLNIGYNYIRYVIPLIGYYV